MSTASVRKFDCELDEIMYCSDPRDRKRLEEYLEKSDEAWYGLHDGNIACVWGLITRTLVTDRAYMWLLTNSLVDQHKFTFVRHSQIVIEDALKRYSEIIGHVHISNERAKKWLRWLGAEFGDIENKHFTFKIKRPKC